MKKLIFILELILAAHFSLAAPLPSFPGAEGFGAIATGGRGGAVYHVTNLNANGPGSFADAVSQPNRMVVFDVGGYIHLDSEVRIAGDITIAGQTAPGEGIATYGQPVSVSNSRNVIVRHMRFRQGVNSNQHKSALMMSDCSDIILDHCSIEWGRWDTVDMGGGSNITLQNCIIGEGISPQRFGCLCQSDFVTFCHDLWISNHSRNPKAKGHVQYINNVLYNYGIGFVGGHSAADHFDDVINNYFIKGPSSGNAFTGEFTATDKLYQTGNFADLDHDGKLNGRLVEPGEFVNATIASAPFFTPQFPVAMDSARSAFRRVVCDVGASLVRDEVDSRLVAELVSLGARGKVISDPAEAGGPGQITGGDTPKDSDGDGVPDYFELAAGTNPNVADSDRTGPSGYTHLEEYVNWLAEPHTMLAKNTAKDLNLGRYAPGFADANPTFAVSNAINGTVALLPDGHTAYFTPARDFTGHASFDYSVTGTDITVMTKKVGLLVSPVR